MSTSEMAVASPETAERSRTGLAIIFKRTMRGPRGRIGAVLLALILAIAVIGPFVAPYQPAQVVGLTFGSPDPANILGTDGLGRDVLSRVLDGGWVLLLLAAGATSIGVLVGAAAGLLAAYMGGWVEMVIMRVVDIVLALPQIIFALLLLSVVGPKLWLLVLAVGISHAPQVARVIYAAAQDVTERDFVRISRLWGVSVSRVLRRDVLPNLLGPLVVEFGLRLSFSIIILSGLSFLGFGRQPPSADWGLMINENRLGLELNPLAVVVPALLLAILAVGANTFGDAIARASIGDESGEETVVASSRGTVVDR